jgi:RNA polymerase sigma factor (sigma-70 family)
VDPAASDDVTPQDASPDASLDPARKAPVDDATLLRLVRAGDDSAYGALFTRHAGAVRGYALRCCADLADAEDMAAEAFFRVLQAVRRGSGPADNVRGYLFTVVRRLAAEWSLRRRDVPVADDELGRQLDAARPAPPPGADLQLIATAFTTLPRRWRAVLWRVEVEGERPAAAASHFGLSANATAALARRAREGLRAAYLQAHLAPSGGATGCRAVVAKLGGFTAGQVTGAEAARIRDHLAGCASCRALHAELRDVCAGLRRHAGSLAPLAGGALGGRHLLLGRALLGRVGHVLAVGTRAKVVVAALSVAAVGGAGLAAGPIITRLDPSPTVDRGVAVGPLLLSTTDPAPATVPPGRLASAFDLAPPPRSRPGTVTGSRPTGLGAPAAGASVAATTWPTGGTADPTSVPGPGTATDPVLPEVFAGPSGTSAQLSVPDTTTVSTAGVQRSAPATESSPMDTTTATSTRQRGWPWHR